MVSETLTAGYNVLCLPQHTIPRSLDNALNLTHLKMAHSTTPLAAVLEFVLQFSDLAESPPSICSLLCTSNETRDATTQHCGGRLVVGNMDTNRKELLRHFLATQGHLMRSLSWETPNPYSMTSLPAAEGDALAAMTASQADAAAVLEHATLLQHLALAPLSPAMLKQAGSSCSQLTHLQLRQSLLRPDDGAEQLLQQAAAALSQLTCLKRLELSSNAVSKKLVH